MLFLSPNVKWGKQTGKKPPVSRWGDPMNFILGGYRPPPLSQPVELKNN